MSCERENKAAYVSWKRGSSWRAGEVRMGSSMLLESGLLEGALGQPELRRQGKLKPLGQVHRWV